jgi:hypothetical protein
VNRAAQLAKTVIAVALLLALSGAGFTRSAVACPMAKPKAPCCPKSQKNHCPQSSSSLQVCPFVVTDGQQALLQAKADIGSLPAPQLHATHFLAAVAGHPPLLPLPAATVDLYLRNHVLLI